MLRKIHLSKDKTMGLLDNKTVLITGVMTDSSLAFGVAQLCIAEGANVILTGAGRPLSLTKRTAKKLGDGIPVYEFDVTEPEHGLALQKVIRENHGGIIDAALHAIGFMPEQGLGKEAPSARWADVAVGYEISAHSICELANTVGLLMPKGSQIVALDFDCSSRYWGPYGLMAGAKAALQANVRMLADSMGSDGITVNCVAAGPMATTAAKSIPGFDKFEAAWDERAPLGWDVKNTLPVAQACLAIFGGMFPATTGSVIPVDGGYMNVGA